MRWWKLNKIKKPAWLGGWGDLSELCHHLPPGVCWSDVTQCKTMRDDETTGLLSATSPVVWFDEIEMEKISIEQEFRETLLPYNFVSSRCCNRNAGFFCVKSDCLHFNSPFPFFPSLLPSSFIWLSIETERCMGFVYHWTKFIPTLINTQRLGSWAGASV